VLIALVIALLATCFEAVSLGGSDNLLVPFGTYFLLTELMPLGAADLELRALVLIGLLVLALLTARLQQLSASGAVGALLVGYAVWSLVGLAWFLPLLVFYLTFNLVRRLPWVAPQHVDMQPEEREIYEISAIFYVSIASVGLVFAYTTGSSQTIWIAFLTTVSANSAISWATLLPSRWLNSLREVRSDKAPSKHFFGLEGVLVVFAGGLPLLPLVWIEAPFELSATTVAIVLSGAAVAVLVKLALGKTLRAVYLTDYGQRTSKPAYLGVHTTYQSGLRWLNTDRAHLLSLLVAMLVVAGLAFWML